MGQMTSALGIAALVGCIANVAMAQMSGHEAHLGGQGNAVVFDPATATVAFSAEPLNGEQLRAGEVARITVTVSDQLTGAPVSDLSVAGWMLLRRNAQVSAEIPCAAKARLFTQGRVTSRPDVDLNAARLLVLNQGNAILVVDPQVDFTITQMENVIPLPGVPADWALSVDGRTVFVSLPLYNAVAVINADNFQVSGLIELPKGTLPTGLLALPGGSVAIYASAQGSVTIARPDGTGQTDPVALGAGPAAFAVADSRLYAASADGHVVVVDTDSGIRLTETFLSEGKPALAISADGTTLLAAHEGQTGVSILDAKTLTPIGKIETPAGTTALAFSPNNQFAMILNGNDNLLQLADLANQIIVDEQTVATAPVEITLSHDYAYIRGLEGDHFTIVELADLDRGVVTPLNVQSASQPMQRREWLADAQLVAPFGHGALVGNPTEGVAYYYMEGMNTPMGTVNLYGPSVRGLMTIDRGFRETAPGTYSTTAKLPFGGTYDVPVAVGAADNVTCFTVPAVQGAAQSQEATAPVVAATLQLPSAGILAGQDNQLVVRLRGDSDQPVAAERIQMLVFSSGGDWQARARGTPVGEGSFAGNWRFPHPGRYGLSIEIPTMGLGYADLPPLYFSVVAEPDANASPKEN